MTYAKTMQAAFHSEMKVLLTNYIANKRGHMLQHDTQWVNIASKDLIMICMKTDKASSWSE